MEVTCVLRGTFLHHRGKVFMSVRSKLSDLSLWYSNPVYGLKATGASFYLFCIWFYWHLFWLLKQNWKCCHCLIESLYNLLLFSYALKVPETSLWEMGHVIELTHEISTEQGKIKILCHTGSSVIQNPLMSGLQHTAGLLLLHKERKGFCMTTALPGKWSGVIFTSSNTTILTLVWKNARALSLRGYCISTFQACVNFIGFGFF